MIHSAFSLLQSDLYLKECLNFNPWLKQYTESQPETGRNPDETDRGGWRGYDRVYSEYISHLKNSSLNILEIGVHSGYGLLAWARYFANSKVYGGETEFKYWIPQYNKMIQDYPEFERVKIFEINSTESADWSNSFDNVMFDIIIDDGSHMPADQVLTLRNGWKYLKSGGYYFIEDISSRYTNPSKQYVFDHVRKLEDAKLSRIYSHVNEGWANILSNREVWDKYGVTDKTPMEFEDYIAVIQKE